MIPLLDGAAFFRFLAESARRRGDPDRARAYDAAARRLEKT